MRVAITGATGNLGTSLLTALARDVRVREIVGIARRLPLLGMPRTRFVAADVVTDDLAPHLAGADAVVHLAWRIQPSHRPDELERNNVAGSARVFAAAARAGVRTLVHASSVGVYASGPKHRLVDEGWPATGIESSTYSRQKAAVERLLDELEREHPEMRVVRVRPAFVFKREAAAGVRKLFVGPFVPRLLFSPRLLRLLPDHPALRFQAVHSLDVGRALRATLVHDVRGAFNLAADPVLDVPRIAAELGAWRVRLPGWLMRGATALGWHLRVVASEPAWIDLALRSPLMDASRARRELGWTPRHTGLEALFELLEGLRSGTELETPPLAEPRHEDDFERGAVGA